VNKVGGRVPVDQVLRVLGALYVEVPELDVTAFADERMAHQVQRERLRGDDASDEEDDLRAGELHGGRSI
jgi:hypothetical protein